MEHVTNIGSVLALVALVAGSFAVWRSSSRTDSARVWQGEAEAQKARGDRLEISLAALEKRVDHLERENATLRELVTSREELARFERWAQDAHAESLACLTRIESAVTHTA